MLPASLSNAQPLLRQVLIHCKAGEESRKLTKSVQRSPGSSAVQLCVADLYKLHQAAVHGEGRTVFRASASRWAHSKDLNMI